MKVCVGTEEKVEAVDKRKILNYSYFSSVVILSITFPTDFLPNTKINRQNVCNYFHRRFILPTVITDFLCIEEIYDPFTSAEHFDRVLLSLKSSKSYTLIRFGIFNNRSGFQWCQAVFVCVFR